ncbi:hypothetical protein NFC81_15845 [Salinispirillum sp. LH 10-3-1]|uniref:Uncharacterized protein n=1 Tax=Salinispirillum sp. LH 10-3-1 TaxID=2952525 RepID=A0AB38YG07_9GAMM
MSITDIEKTILFARACDEQRQDQTLSLPTSNAWDERELRDFLNRYIEQLPVSLKTAAMAARQLSLEDTVEPILQAVESFFISECELSSQGGLTALLDRTYLGHRMLEELNDHLFVRTGHYLIHTDMTEANLLAHSLLGDPYASELDGIVAQTLDALTGALKIASGAGRAHNTEQMLKPFAVQGDKRLKLPY